MVNGRQYYQCTAGHGLFAAPSKVTKIIDRPANPVVQLPEQAVSPDPHGNSNGLSATRSAASASSPSAARRYVLLARAQLDLEQLQADLEFARQESSVLHQELREKDAELEALAKGMSAETQDQVRSGTWSLINPP